MSLTKIDFQAVGLVTPGETLQDLSAQCNCKGRDFCQLIERADDTCFQLISSPTGGELVNDGAFVNPCSTSDWSCGTGWSITGGEAFHTAGSSGSITQSIDIEDNRYYRISFKLRNSTANGTMNVFLGGVLVASISPSTGDALYYNCYFLLTGSSNTNINFSADDKEFQVDDVTVKRMGAPGFQILNLDTDVVAYEEFDGTSVTYYEVVQSFSSKALADAATTQNVQVCIDWNQVATDDCYYLKIIDVGDDDSELVTNGDFSSGTGWTAGGNWSIGSGVASINDPLATGSTLSQNLSSALQGGKCYTLTFDVLNYTSGNFDSIQIDSYNIALPPSIITGNGSYSFDIDLTGETGTFTQLKFNSAGEGNNVFDIDDVSIVIQNECKTLAYESECFNVKDSHSCEIVMTWTNDENAFGIDYNNFTYTQQMRHGGKFWKPSYAKEKNIHNDSSGDRKILRSESKKIKRLTLEEMPEYMHDAVAIALEHDTFTVNGTEYVNEENDYDPNWRNSSLLAPVEIELTYDDLELINANC